MELWSSGVKKGGGGGQTLLRTSALSAALKLMHPQVGLKISESSLGSSRTPVGSALMDSKEVEGLGPGELLLLLLLLSSGAEDSVSCCRAQRDETEFTIVLISVPGPPLIAISAVGPATH